MSWNQNSNGWKQTGNGLKQSPRSGWNQTNGFSNPFLGPKSFASQGQQQNTLGLLNKAIYNGTYNYINSPTPFDSSHANKAIASNAATSNAAYDSLSDQANSTAARNGLRNQGVTQAANSQLASERASEQANLASNIRETYNQNDYMTRWGQLTQFTQMKQIYEAIKAAYENERLQEVALNKQEDAQKRAQQNALLGGVFGAFTGGLGSLFSAGGSKS